MMQQRSVAGFKIKLVTCPETKTTVEEISFVLQSLITMKDILKAR